MASLALLLVALPSPAPQDDYIELLSTGVPTTRAARWALSARS